MTATDPICKMKVEEKGARFTSIYEGKTYFFCSQGCKKTFESDPRRHAN